MSVSRWGEEIGGSHFGPFALTFVDIDIVSILGRIVF